MTDRHAIAYALLTLMLIAGAYLVFRWRQHLRLERRRMSGRYDR